MKNKTIKIILILTMLLSLTGCTKILKTSDGKVVKNPTTGQNLTENILCQPQNEETRKIYEDNSIKLEDYPKCEEFKIANAKYDGIWATIFVKPLAWLILKIGMLLKSYGLAIIIVTLLLRAIMIPITQKTAVQSENMAKAKPELEKLEQKYKNKTDRDSTMQKSQEMMMIYKKYKISPLAGCVFGLIQIPLFFAFYEALNRLPVIFEENFLGFQLGTTSITAMSNAKFYYIIFNIIVITITYFSFKLNKTATVGKEQEQQMKMMSNIGVIMISVMSFSLPIGIGIYWIFNSGFTVIQNLLVKRGKKNA